MLLILINSGQKNLRPGSFWEVLLCCFILLSNPALSSFSEKLPGPKLSLSSPGTAVTNRYSREMFYSVFDGHPVVVTCSVDSPQRVSSFNLSSNGVHVLPAVDNAAHFIFPGADVKQTYIWRVSCVYNFETNPEVKSPETLIIISVEQSSYVRLVGGESRCFGRLELQHEREWRAVSHQHWSLKEAAVVCRQLHCGSVVSTDTQSRELQPVWRFYSDCDGSERALLGCGSVRDGQSVSTVSVLCSGILHKPTISLVTANLLKQKDPMIVYSPYSFYINCSVLPQFPGGHFSLVFSGVKPSLILNQTAVNHSAVFTFVLSEKAQSGKYSCIYHNTVYGHNISSQSQEITIVVEDSHNLLLDDGLQRNGTKACSGKLLLRHKASQMKMVTAESSGWDERHASIVCRQLDCGNKVVSTSKIELPNVTPMWRFYSDCDGSEAALLQCGHVQKWFSSKAIEVVCEG